MKLRNKIFLSLGGLLVIAIGALMTVTAYESACPPPSPDSTAPDAMRAVVRQCYGVQALHVERIARPTPAEDEVLIRVRAAGVNPLDWHVATGKPYLMRLESGIGRPKSTHAGVDVAGTVEAVGAKVTRFKPGDAVFGTAGGAMSEYTTASPDDLVLKPDNLSFQEAAGIPIAATTALQGLRDHGQLKAGQKVLINGASGGVGIYAVQIAKALGADVTGVCSTRNVEMVRSLGADQVIDYTKEDFTQGAQQYDLILDNVGNHGYRALAKVTQPTGYIVTVGGPKSNPWLGPLSRILIDRNLAGLFVDTHLPFMLAQTNNRDLQTLADWAREGKLRTVIDQQYSLEQVQEALNHVATGRSRGKLLITLE